MVLLLSGFLWLVRGLGPTDLAGRYRVTLTDYRAPDPTGVPANLASVDIVRRGEYLARAADCEACQTAKGGSPYAGGRASRRRSRGKPLYPGMPYANYTYMTDADALAIKAYLFSLKPAYSPAGRNTLVFPFGQRWLMTRFEPNREQSGIAAHTSSKPWSIAVNAIRRETCFRRSTIDSNSRARCKLDGGQYLFR